MDDNQFVDSKAEVYLTSDLMKAYINISKPEEGGKTLSYNDLEEALHNKKVKFGINKAELLKLSKNPVYDKDILIAEGISQVDGKDGTYEFKFRYKDLGIPKIKEDDTVDYFDLGIVQNVRKGDVLCIITKPDEGSEGQTVTGNIIKQKIGKPVPVLLGKNVEYGDENEEIIVSSIDGRVFLQGGKVNVEDEFYIKGNVDRSTGNIDFIGSITVGGIVEEGFSVKAGGNITVKGIVSSAILEAEGDINLKTGLVSSKIKCKGNIDSGFIENSEVQCDGDIISQYIINSNTEAGKNVIVTKGVGKIIGGITMAKDLISAKQIGSDKSVRTEIIIGINPKIINRKDYINDILPEHKKKIKSLQSLLGLLSDYEKAGKLTEDKAKILENAKYNYDTISEEIESMEEELKSINEEIRNSVKGTVKCSDMIFGGTKVSIGKRNLLIKGNEPRVLLQLKDDEIEMTYN